MAKVQLSLPKTDEYVKNEQLQKTLDDIATKKANGSLTLDDIYTQNEVIIQMIQKLGGPTNG